MSGPCLKLQRSLSVHSRGCGNPGFAKIARPSTGKDWVPAQKGVYARLRGLCAGTIGLRRPRMKQFFLLLVAIALTAFGIAPVDAQSYPTKPIRIIVSTSPGGITDIAVRILGQHITAKTGQAVVIDNRAGASGNIAMEAVARAAQDGYTLGFANTGNITINPYLFHNMPFDPLTDLVPVGTIGTVPLFLVINGKLAPKTLAEFIAYAKANPDK